MTAQDKTAAIEARAEEKVAAWRESRAETETLKNELLKLIRDETVNSAALMRMLSEVLLYNSEPVEALAAFNTYMDDQDLQLLKARSGARANPDPLERTAYISALFLTKVEGLIEVGEARIERLEKQISMLLERLDDERRASVRAESGMAALLARISLNRAFHTQDSHDYDRFMNEAGKRFEDVPVDGNVDVETEYARGLYLVLTQGPHEAFAPVKRALTSCPNHIRTSLLFVQLLSAESQYEASLRIAQAYLNQNLVAKTELDKLALLELKKTQIALLELLKGAEAALAELPDFITLAASLFTNAQETRVVPNGKESNGAVASPTSSVNGSAAQSQQAPHSPHPQQNGHGRLFPFRRRAATVSSIASTTSTPTRGMSKKEVTAAESRIMAAQWFWVAQQYAKVGIEPEARLANDEARKFYNRDTNGTSESNTLQGQLLHESNPVKALKQYRASLEANPLNIGAAIGIARIIKDSKPEDHDNELLGNLVVTLDAICARCPGRFIPEVWFARGLLYDVLGGTAEARKMYWKTVELEERRSVTRYLLPIAPLSS